MKPMPEVKISNITEVELISGEVITPVTRITEGGFNDDLVNVHTPGSGYRVVPRDEISEVR